MWKWRTKANPLIQKKKEFTEKMLLNRLEQNHNTSLHEKCAICVHQNLRLNESDLPAELLELVSVWSKLPEHTKNSIGVV